jgi:hypothetical protein
MKKAEKYVDPEQPLQSISIGGISVASFQRTPFLRCVKNPID